jgi:hypothetical protein
MVIDVLLEGDDFSGPPGGAGQPLFHGNARARRDAGMPLAARVGSSFFFLPFFLFNALDDLS